MKTFTIGLPKYNNDNKGSIKNYILKSVAEQFPFFKWNLNENEKYNNISYAGPADRLIFDFNTGSPKFYALNKRFWNPFSKHVDDNAENYSSLDLMRAMIKLRKYADQYNDYLSDPGYDYINQFGQPVRIYQNFIQIGDHIIPFKGYGMFLDKKKENKYINIIMNIYNSIDVKLSA